MPPPGVLGVATGAIAIGTVATSTSTTTIILIRTITSTATSAAKGKVIGNTIRNIAEMHRMVIEEPRTSLAVKVLAVRVELVIVPEAESVRDPVAVQVALVVPEDQVELAVQAALVVLERLAVQEALVVPEDPAVPVALERELVQVEAEVVRDHPRVQLALPLKTKSAIALRPPGLHPLLAAAEDWAAAVAEITLAPAAAEAVTAWEVAG